MHHTARGRVLRRAASLAVVSAIALGVAVTTAAPAVAAPGAVAPSGVAPATRGPITSPGPLTSIDTRTNLGCQVSYDGVWQFYGNPGCRTSLASEGSVMGDLGTNWTPVSQDLTGTGSATDPYVLETVVTGGGWDVTKIDRYVAGKGDYRSEVRVTNTRSTDRETILSHVGDCRLEGEDKGYGEVDVDTGAVTCLGNPAGSEEPGQVESFIPTTAGATFGYGWWIPLYQAIRDAESLDNRQFTPVDTKVDNGMGISWKKKISAGATEVFEWTNHFSKGEEPAGETSAQGTLHDTDGNGRPDAGETVSYVVAVENTGNVPLVDGRIEAPRGMEVTCPTPISVGASADCETSTPLELTQADIDAGSVSAEFTFAASTPKGTEYTADPTAADVQLAAVPSGKTTTSVSGEVPAAGATVQVVSTLQNTGNVTLSGLATAVNGAAVDCATRRLAPGGSTECTLEHVVTQAEFDAGQLVFRTEATGTTPNGSSATLTASEAQADFDRRSALVTTLRPEVGGGAPGAGDTIGLDVTVRNDGNASLKDITAVVDGGAGFQVDCPTPSLAPGASIDCDVTGSHTVTQADVDRGSVPFRATAQAVDATGATVRNAATTSQQTVAQAPAVSATVLPELRTAGKVPVAGDVVALTVRAANTGNVTVHDVAGVIAHRDGLAVECPEGSLVPGASIDCTVPTYSLTQGDVDEGEVVFEASVSAVAPNDQRVDGSDTATLTVDRQHGIVTTAAAAIAAGPDAPEAGDRIELTVSSRNTGNTTLRGFAVEVVGRDLVTECADVAVAPGGDITCTIADHVLTQAEVDAGEVTFHVVVTANGPAGTRAEAKDSVSVEIARVPAIEMTATSVLDANDHEAPLAGDTATVTMTIRNTGTVSVTGVVGTVAERDGLEVDCPEDSLAPAEHMTCTVSAYTLAQSDADAGSVRIDVIAAATGANRERAEARADTTLTIVRAPAIATTATSALAATDREHPFAGDAATVRLAIANTGNVTVRDLAGTVTGRAGMVVTCPAQSLAPGKTADCEPSEYALTQGDVDAGKTGFELSGRALGSDGRAMSATARTGFDIERAPQVDAQVVAHLAASDHDVPRAGDLVEVGVHASNTGNVTLDGARAEITELADLPVTCTEGATAPGASVDCTVPDYVITQADIDHGRVTVAAVLDADGPADTVVADRDEVRVGLEAKRVLDLSAEPVVRDSDGELRVLEEDRKLRPQDTVSVRYTIVNTGNLVIDDVQHALRMPALDVEQTVLQPGERTSAVTSTAHTVTDADAVTGTVVLVGQVQGTTTRADGEAAEEPGAATIGQSSTTDTATEAAATGGQRVQVLSAEVRTSIGAEPAPAELAFTGSEITRIALPAGIVLLLAGGVLLVWVQRRRRESEREDNPRA